MEGEFDDGRRIICPRCSRNIQTLFAMRERPTVCPTGSFGTSLNGLLDASAEAAFEGLVQRHGPMVLRLCYKAAVATRRMRRKRFRRLFY